MSRGSLRAAGLVAALLGVLLGSAAHADIGPGVTVKLVGISGPGTGGVPLAFGIRVQAPQAVTLRSFSLRGGTVTGGPPPVTGLPDSLVLAANVPAEFTIHTVPSGNALVYKLQFQMNERVVVNVFDLSRSHFDRMYRANESVPVPDEPLPLIAPGWDSDPGAPPAAPRPAVLRALHDLRQTPAGVQAVTGRNVRVKGRIAYKRDDAQTIGADRITVRILDQETGPSDDLLDELRTNTDGTFDVTVWSDENEPDLYLEVITNSGAAEVQDGTWNTAYRWETGVKVDFSGATADFGTRMPPDDYLRAAVHMYTNLVRGWRFYKNTMNVTPPKQVLEWPSGDWPHYDPFGGDLHIPIEVGGNTTWKYAWATDVHLHEYGHFLTNEVQDYSPSNSYDNGVCNNANGDPGHCAWCEEDGGTAIKEGWSNFYSDQVTQGWTAAYGIAPNATRDQEDLKPCMDSDGAPCSCDPFTTEGHLGRLLRDLADSANELDDLAATNGEDLLSVGAHDVIQVFHAHDIDSPAEYIQRFRQDYPGVNPGSLWATLANNQYVLADNTAPAVPSGFGSTDHTVGQSNADATITMTWNPASDDFSGVDHYNVWYKLSTSASWGSVHSTPNTFYTTPELNAGFYDFRIQSVDRAGNPSALGQYGSFGVRDPWPADLTSITPAGWDANIVPRSDATATSASAAVTPTLPGGTSGTYLNVAGRNAGESTTETVHQIRILLDGMPVDSATFNLTGPAVQFQTRNRGPRTVRGGRHTLEAWYDGDEQNIEISETNNRKGAQYVWTGEKVGISVRERRAAPPDPTGGHNSFTVPIPNVKFKNVDGLYYSHTRTLPVFTTYSWAAMWIAPLSNTANYDCYIQTHSTGTEDGGYTTGLVTSSRPAGQLDAVITNLADVWDVGVLNTSRSTSDYFASCVVAPTAPLGVGDSITITLADSAMMAMRAFTPPAGSSKTLVKVRRTSGTAPIYTLWLDDSQTYGTISQYNGKVGTDASGASELTVTATSAAENGLVFYRNPSDGWGAVTFTVVIQAKPGDPAPSAPSGWYSAFVPRPLADATAASVPAPASLTGETAVTYLNASVTNQSDAPSGSFRVDLRVDRSPLGQLLYLNLGANAQVKANNFSPVLFTSGRHVLHMNVDAAGLLPETNEANNRFGEQWVWSPPASPLNAPLWRRGTTGSPVEGWEACSPAEELAFDMDGLRSPVFSAATTAGWAGFAAVPTTGGDVDLQLFDTSSGPKNGFADALGFSQWDGGATDFVLVNFGATAYRALDAGVVRASNDTTSYLANIVNATLRAPAAGVHGPFTLGAGRVLELHAFDLSAGHHVIDLVNQSGGADFGLAVYAGPRPYPNRTDGEDLAASDASPAGGHEQIVFDLPTPQRVCLAVWKTGASEQAKAGTYALAVDAAWVGAEPAAVAATRLLGARPSPFAEGTTIAFDLARTGPATVEVFDVAGARVRTLGSGVRAAGRHAIAWDGADDAGRRLPPGLYLVRLKAGEATSTAKVVRAR